MPDGRTTAELQPRNVHVFGATSFLNDTATEMAYWVLPAFLGTIGAGAATLGIIEGIAESVASFAKLFSGYFADRVRRRKPLVVSGYVVANAVKPLLAVVTSAWQVLLIRFADRLAKGVRGAPRDVMLSESVPRERLGAAFGLLQAMDSAGAIAGPLLAMAILAQFADQTIGLRAVFWAAAVPGALAIIIVWSFLKESPHDRSAAKSLNIFAGARELPGAFYFVLFALAVFSVGNSSDMFLVLRAQDVGVPVKHAPLLGLVFNITYTAASWPAGKLSDRAASRDGNSSWRYWTASAGLLIFAIVYWVFAFAPSARVLYAMMALYGLYYALTQPVLKAIVVDAVPSDMRGRAFGLFYFVTSIAALLASVITGALWKKFGAALPFHLSAVFALVAAMLLILTPKIFKPDHLRG